MKLILNGTKTSLRFENMTKNITDAALIWQNTKQICFNALLTDQKTKYNIIVLLLRT